MRRTKSPVKFQQLRPKDKKKFQQWLYQYQKGRCPVLRRKIKFWDAVLDHKHKLKAQKPGPKGRGLIRGLLDYRVNGFEGVVLKKYKKYGLRDEIPLPVLLRNLADYLENPVCPQKYIHPSEKIKNPILKKSEYNLIVKYYKQMFPKSRKIPEYPKSGIKKTKSGNIQYKYRITAKWQRLLNQAQKLKKAAK